MAFNGIALRYKTTNLTADAFTTLAAGQTLEATFDVASTADLSAGGAYTVAYSGSIPFAAADSTALAGSYVFETNELSIDVDGAAAAMVKRAVDTEDIVRRSKVTSCTTSEKTAVTRALSNTVSLASAAAAEASAGTARYTRFFKSSTYQARVAARLKAVAAEAKSTTSGVTTYYCEDPYGYCETNVLAWTLPSNNIVANCDIYYSDLPALASSCYAQDQATTTLHEFTHANGVYSPGTDDLGYGYSAATALSAANAFNNADSYALFANGEFFPLIYLPIQDSVLT